MKVKVRIAVAVDSSGEWTSSGWNGCDAEDAKALASDAVGDPYAIYWIEAELDAPEVATVQGKVTRA